MKRLKIPLKYSAQIGIILGSGWPVLDSEYRVQRRIHYQDLPGFPAPTVPGHAGELILATLNNIPIAILAGRVHLYEGYSPDEVVYPVRLLARLGVRTLIITNATGAVNPEFTPGDLMFIKDQLNLQFQHLGPLRALSPYSPDLLKTAQRAARLMRLQVHTGIYAGVTGPNYETAAEVRMLRKMGADAVGMSTVLESTTAAAGGMRVLGLSCLVNRATGLSRQPLRHSEVLKAMSRVQGKSRRLLKALIVAFTRHPYLSPCGREEVRGNKSKRQQL